MIRRRLLLKQGKFYLNGEFTPADLRITGSTISAIGPNLRPERSDMVLPLNGRLVVPGLINSHDHLEFNLFPHLGKPPYQNYVDWSEDIQRTQQKEIQEILRVPLNLRLLWGAYKNILSGVTTVVHHNKYYLRLRLNYPISVFRNYAWIHSLRLEKRDLAKLVNDHSRKTFIHLSEGIDLVARGELKELYRMGGLGSNTVVVHGVGLTAEDIDIIAAAGAAVVWCPSSNLYLFGQTAPIASMAGRITLLLGTDSTLTGSLSMFDELRVAQKLSMLASKDLLNMVTTIPSRLFDLNGGRIEVGASGDLLVFDERAQDPFQTFLELTPARVVCLFRGGRPIFGDVAFTDKLLGRIASHQRLHFEGCEKFIVGNLLKLTERIRSYAPGISFSKWNLPYPNQVS